ncbi:MAG: tetratricopeptide repeat protein [bacterium]|nr:tetratricopeptide repeat protein [bacterium]
MLLRIFRLNTGLMVMIALLVTLTAAGTSWAVAKANTVEEKIVRLAAKVQEDPTDGRSWNDLGVLYAQEGQFDQARDSFIRAVQTNPQEGDFHRNLGLAFSRLNNYSLAVAEFKAYKRFDAMGGIDYWRLIGHAQVQAGNTDDARATFNEGIDMLSPTLGAEGLRLVLALNKLEMNAGKDDVVRELLKKHTPAAVTFVKNAHDEADDGYMEAKSIIHNQVGQMVDDGKLMEESGLLPEAGKLYSEAYKMAPERDDLLPRLVDVYLKEGRSMDARVAARLARDDHPDKAGTWIATAKVHETHDRLDDAIVAYERAYEIDPEIDGLRVAIGNLLMRQGRDREASKYLKDGVISSETKPEVVYNYAVSLMRDKKYHGAIPSLKSVTAQLPEMYQGWLALAQCYQQTKQYSLAVAPYEKAYALNPDPKLLFHLARCAQKSKQYKKSISAYEGALKDDPGYVKARYNLSLTFMDAKKYSEAVDSFQKLVELEGDTYRAYYSMGLSYYYQELYDEALESYDMALEQKETVNVLNNIGLVYAALGDKKSAKRYYDDAKALKGGK